MLLRLAWPVKRRKHSLPAPGVPAIMLLDAGDIVLAAGFLIERFPAPLSRLGRSLVRPLINHPYINRDVNLRRGVPCARQLLNRVSWSNLPAHSGCWQRKA